MRNLYYYAKECMNELDAINIPYGKVVEWTVNTRARRRWGQCEIEGKEYRININELLLDERNSVEGLKNTIIHELLHTVKGCMNHTENWQRAANIVNKAYGYKIKRTSSADEIGLCKEAKQQLIDEYKQKMASKPEYHLKCVRCSYDYVCHRAGKWVNNYERYYCPECHNKLSLIKKGI